MINVSCLTKKPIEKKDIIDPVNIQKILDQQRDILQEIMRLPAEELTTEIKTTIEKVCNFVAISYANLASYYRNNKKINSAIKCYYDVLKIYDVHLPSKPLDEKIMVYGKLIFALFQAQNYKALLTLSNKVCPLFHLLKKSKLNDLITESILSHKAKALLQQAKKMLKETGEEEKIKGILKEVSLIVSVLLLPISRGDEILKEHSEVQKQLTKVMAISPKERTARVSVINSFTLYQSHRNENAKFLSSYKHPLLDREEEYRANRT